MAVAYQGLLSSLLFISLLELSVGVFCLVVAALAWPYRDRPSGTPLVLLGLLAAGWAITAGIASLVADPAVTRWAQFGTYAFAGPTAICWFYVVVGHLDLSWWRQQRVIFAVAGVVGSQWLALVTQPVHQLFVLTPIQIDPAGVIDPTPGPLLLAMMAVNTGFILAGIVALVQPSTSREGILKTQSTMLVVAGIIPLATAAAELGDFVDIPGLDFSVIGIATTAGIILWALFYAAFLDVVPIARETLFENITDAVVAIDTAGRVVDLNTPAKSLFGVDTDSIGVSATAIFEWIDDSTDLATSSEPVEMTVDVDGETRQYEFTVSPISAPSTDVLTASQCGSLLIFRDVTHTKQRESELELKNDRLEAFSSIVSHDLRNPLNVAQGRMELARQEHESEHFAAMARSLDRMETLIEELLLLARKGKVVTETESVRLAVLVEACWNNVVTDDVALVVDTDQLLEADPNRLRELLENLLRNSVEHGSTSSQRDSHGDNNTEHGESALTITVGDLDNREGFYIADDGRGIPAADRERIFESGYSNSDTGTGLGLAIVSEIAKAHGWQIQLTESNGGGARFEFVVDQRGN